MKKVSKGLTDIIEIALAAVLITLCAWITIPFGTVRFTLQLLGVYLALFSLGGRKGFFSVLLYIFLGFIGIPVFSGFGSGFAVLIGATGGYIWGFLVVALLFWLAELIFKPKTRVVKLAVSFALLLICYAIGTVWFVCVYSGDAGFASALLLCVLPYIIPDIIKIIIAYKLGNKLIKLNSAIL